MVGGVVIGITRARGQTHVNVADCPHYPKHGIKAESVEGCPYPDTCCVYTDEVAIDKGGELIYIQIGDSFWWQSGNCYWTPKENRALPNGKGGIDYDIKLRKIGYSH